MSEHDRRIRRLERYDALRAERPAHFVNPPGAAFDIILDRSEQLAAAERASGELREKGIPEEFGDMGVVYEDPYILLVRDAVRFRDGHVGAYIREFGTDPGIGAAVLPLLPDGRIVLIRHFRHGLRDWQWEIPRGFAENGSDGATTAARELAEELGVDGATVEPLGRIATDGAFDEIYLARLAPGSLPAELSSEAAHEGIDERRLCTQDELAGMISAGDVTDLYLLAAWAFATAKRLL